MSARTIWILRASLETITALLLMGTTDATIGAWFQAHKGVVVGIIVMKLFVSSYLQQSGNALDTASDLKQSAAQAGK